MVAPGAGLVPIEDAAHEGGNQGDPRLGAGHRLGKAEQQGEVAVDAFLLQGFRRLDPFPGGGHLDQHPVGANAGGLIQANQLAGLGNRGFRIEAEAGIHFGGNPAGHQLENFAAEDHADFIEGLEHHVFRRRIGSDHGPGLAQGRVDQVLVGGNLGRRQDQRRVGGGIPRGELLDGFEFAGVGDDHRHGGKLVEQVGHGVGVGGRRHRPDGAVKLASRTGRETLLIAPV